MSKVDELRKRHERALEEEQTRQRAEQEREEDEKNAATGAQEALIGLRDVLGELLRYLKADDAEVKVGAELHEALGIVVPPETFGLVLPDLFSLFVPQLGCIYRDRAVGFRVVVQGVVARTEAETFKLQQGGMWLPSRSPGSPFRDPSGKHPSALNSKDALAIAFETEWEFLLKLKPGC